MTANDDELWTCPHGFISYCPQCAALAVPAGRGETADMPADLYNRLMNHLLGDGSRDGLLISGEINKLYGASARRRNAPVSPIAVQGEGDGPSADLIESWIADWDFQMREDGPTPAPLADFLHAKLRAVPAVQGVTAERGDYHEGLEEGIKIGRREAFTESADICERIQADTEWPDSGPGVVGAKVIIRGLATGPTVAPSEPRAETVKLDPKPWMSVTHVRHSHLASCSGGYCTFEPRAEFSQQIGDYGITPSAETEQ